MNEDLDQRDLRRPKQPPTSSPTLVDEQVALVVGVGDVLANPLVNATSDAVAVGELLQKDFAFRLLPDGEPLLDADAGRETLRRLIEETLDAATSTTRWLFYFAGHGVPPAPDARQGFLVPFGTDPEDRKQLLSLRWLMDRALESRCAEILIVLDACHSGSALLRADVKPLEEERGTVQVLAAGRPDQTVLDGYGEGHSVFTQCLIEALDGRAGIHDDDGIRFTTLHGHLATEVDRRLRAAEVENRQQLLGVSVRLSTKGNLQGEFRFQPRWPRLPSAIVRGIRDEDPQVRRTSLIRLERACLERPAELSEEQRLAWSLPLARKLALTGLRQRPLEDVSSTQAPFTEAPSTEPDWKVRQQQARTLGILGQLDRSAANVNPVSEVLLLLAACDTDPSVRDAARRSLARLLNQAEQRKVGHRLERLRMDSTQPQRRWLRQAQAMLWSYGHELGPLSLAVTLAIRVGFAAGVGWRSVVRYRWPRRIATGLVVAVGVFYLVLGTTYHLSEGSLSEIEVRMGLPGLEAFLPVTAVMTGFYASQLENPIILAEGRLVGSWLWPRDGAFGWGRQLTEHLRPGLAALAWWRLDDLERALEETRDGIAAGDSDCVRVAAYLAFQSDAAFEPALVQILEALDSNTSNVRDEALRSLEMLRRARPEMVGETLQRLRSATPAWIDAVTVLDGDAATLTDALRTALALLDENPDARLGQRLQEAVERLLEAHPELSAEHLHDVLRLSLKRTEGRGVLLEAAAKVTGTGSRRQTVTAVLRLLEIPGEPGRFSALGLLPRLIEDDPELTARSRPVLVALAGDEDPEIVLAAADVVAGLSVEPVPGRSAFTVRLQQILHREGRSLLRTRALEGLVTLSGTATDGDLVRTLTDATADEDVGVSGKAVSLLLELALSGRIDPAELRDPLGRLLSDPSPGIQDIAARAALLLADRLGAHFDVAFDIAMKEINAPQQAAARQWGRSFGRATPAAAARFGRRLLLELRAGKGDSYRLQQSFEELVLNQPTILPELAPTLTLLLTDPRWPNLKTDLLFRFGSLQRRGADLKPLSERFREQLASSEDQDREAAAYVLGSLIAGEAEPARSLAAMTHALNDPAPQVRAAAARSLLTLAQSGHAARIASLVLRGLEDAQPEVRRAFAEALPAVAKNHPTAVPVPFPAALRSAAGEPDPEVRRDVGQALKYCARQRQEVAREELWLQQRLAAEDDPVVRLRLATAWTAATDGPESVARLTSLVETALASGEEEQQREAIQTLGELAVTRPAQARRALRMLREALPVSRHWGDPFVVSILRQAALSDPDLGYLVVDTLAAVLAEERDDRLRWNVIASGLNPVVRSQPELASEVRDQLRRFLRRESGREGLPARPEHYRQRLLAEAWTSWIALSVEPAAEDPRILWWGLRSRFPGGRAAALQVIELLAVEHPEKVPELREALERRRRSVHPHVRMAAVEALETITVLEWTRSHLDDPEGFERWQGVLGWLVNAPLRISVGEAVNRLRGQ